MSSFLPVGLQSPMHRDEFKMSFWIRGRKLQGKKILGPSKNNPEVQEAAQERELKCKQRVEECWQNARRVLPWEGVARKTSEVSDLLVTVVLVQGTAQGYNAKPLPSCHPGPEAHHVKSGCSQEPLQLLKRATFSCLPSRVICILTEILDNPNKAPAGPVTG